MIHFAFDQSIIQKYYRLIFYESANILNDKSFQLTGNYLKVKHAAQEEPFLFLFPSLSPTFFLPRSPSVNLLP